MTALLIENMVAAIITLFTLIIADRISRPTGKLLYAQPHFFSHIIPNADATIQALELNLAKLVLHNKGRAVCKNVQIVFNFKPEHFEIFPSVEMSSEVMGDGRYLMTFPMLNPNEALDIELITANNPLPIIQSVRFEGGVGKMVAVFQIQVFPWWYGRSIQLLAAVGFFVLAKAGVAVVWPFIH